MCRQLSLTDPPKPPLSPGPPVPYCPRTPLPARGHPRSPLGPPASQPSTGAGDVNEVKAARSRQPSRPHCPPTGQPHPGPSEPSDAPSYIPSEQDRVARSHTAGPRTEGASQTDLRGAGRPFDLKKSEIRRGSGGRAGPVALGHPSRGRETSPPWLPPRRRRRRRARRPPLRSQREGPAKGTPAHQNPNLPRILTRGRPAGRRSRVTGVGPKGSLSWRGRRRAAGRTPWVVPHARAIVATGPRAWTPSPLARVVGSGSSGCPEPAVRRTRRRDGCSRNSAQGRRAAGPRGAARPFGSCGPASRSPIAPIDWRSTGNG